MIRLLLTSGRGPAECRIALTKVLELLTRQAHALGSDVDVAASADPDGWGPASAIIVLHGDGAAAFARGWIGKIQWIAQSPVRPRHKRKNWFIGIFELPPVLAKPEALADCDVRFEVFRAGGPGGQHQNKTESAVRATHRPSGLSVVAREERSQHRNKAVARERLTALLRLAEDLAVRAERRDAHAAHDRLVRGEPVKRFHGDEFHPA
jgi:peptide chain release factor